MKWTFILAVLTIGNALGVEPRFRAETIDPDIKIGYGLAIGDVNGDGKPDILLADQFDIVWYENPSWERHVIASKLTLRDNVCLAAQDLDGDGKVEVAVGANWNPGNTLSRRESGSVHYLIPPEDRTKRWSSVRLPSEPTVHRMHWVLAKDGTASLVVLPLHGIGNRGGEGDNGVRIFAYERPVALLESPASWKMSLLDESLHKTHNLDLSGQELAIGGAEGLKLIHAEQPSHSTHWLGEPDSIFPSGGIGEVRWGPYDREHKEKNHRTFATIEPLHGNEVVVYDPEKKRTVLDDSLKQGHALVCAQFVDGPRQQVVAGWRDKNAEGKVGIRMYLWEDGNWSRRTIDDDTMACEDLKAADLNADGKLDLIASGRSTKNVIIYWNES